jgi:hypothetical protein
MYALLAINGYEETVTVRVITVGESPTILKQWISRPSMYWWNKDNDSGMPPKLTWLHMDENTLRAVYYGKVLGKECTLLQIVKIEAYGT